jgi:hypothetical protein
MTFFMKILACLLFLFLCIRCAPHPSHQEQLQPVLQIGSFSLMEDEYRYWNDKLKSKHIDSVQRQQQIREQAYILAYAQEHHYDTISSLNKHLDYALKFFVSQVDGYLWNKEVKPKLQITDSLLQIAYKKRAFTYHIDLIRLSDTVKTIAHLGTPDQSLFNHLKTLTPKEQFHPISLTYPFLPYGSYTEGLDHAQMGEVIGPFETEQGLYIMRVNRITPSSIPPFKDIETFLRQDLTTRMTNKYVFESVKRIKAETNPRFNNIALTHLCKSYDPVKNQWPVQLDSLLLMQYSFHRKTKSFKGKDFKEFIQYQPLFFGSLQNTEDVKKMIETYLIGEFLYHEAQKFSPEHDKAYTLAKGWLRNHFYVNYFKEKHILPNIQITEQDVINYYHTKKDEVKPFDQEKEKMRQELYVKKEKELSKNEIERLKKRYPLALDKIT